MDVNAGPELPHERRLRMVLDTGRPDAVARQHARGRRTARERIADLVDEQSFSEIGALARPEDADVPADAIVTGTARIDGRPVVVMSTDFTAAGGSNGEVGNEKQRRCWEIAASRGIPVVMLFDGGGHRLQEGLDARTFAGGFDIHHTLTRLSGWVPLVAVMLGPGYGQPTLAASLCDYVVAVRGAQVGMAPAPLVRSATGEDVEEEALFGADAQAGFGTVDLAVDTEEEALDAVRWYLDLLPANADQPPHLAPPEPPAHARIDEVVPPELRTGYDMQEVLVGLVDDDSLVELKSGHARNLITALARIEGRPLGIVANQPLHLAGSLDAAAARKAAHLVSLCDAFGLPVLVLIDLPGLAVGSAAERDGLARATAQLSLAFGAATVPLMTVIARKGYGGGYVILSGGRSFDAELVIAWPYAETAVMAVETAVELVHRREVAAGADREEIAAKYRAQLDAVRAAEGFGVDVVLRPSQTRARIAETLAHWPAHQPMHRTLQTWTPRRHPVAPL